jgi:hypothetical protein
MWTITDKRIAAPFVLLAVGVWGGCSRTNPTESDKDSPNSISRVTADDPTYSTPNLLNLAPQSDLSKLTLPPRVVTEIKAPQETPQESPIRRNLPAAVGGLSYVWYAYQLYKGRSGSLSSTIVYLVNDTAIFMTSLAFPEKGDAEPKLLAVYIAISAAIIAILARKRTENEQSTEGLGSPPNSAKISLARLWNEFNPTEKAYLSTSGVAIAMMTALNASAIKSTLAVHLAAGLGIAVNFLAALPLIDDMRIIPSDDRCREARGQMSDWMCSWKVVGACGPFIGITISYFLMIDFGNLKSLTWITPSGMLAAAALVTYCSGVEAWRIYKRKL